MINEEPEYSYFERIYHRGRKPYYKIGDTLAYYEFYADYEGEQIIGKVTDVKLDEEYDDWKYTFENGNQEYEESLMNDETYKKK